MQQKNQRKQFHILLVLCMAALILILDLCFFLMPDQESSEQENRTLQQLPTFSWNSLSKGRFTSQFDTYVADQFPFRDSWVGLETGLQRLLGNTLSNQIFLGKNGYLIQQFEEPSEQEYTEFLQELSQFREEGRSVYALIAPTAVSILEDELPLFAAGTVAGAEAAFLEQLYLDLAEAGVRGIDVSPVLKALNTEGTQVYYRTDHHWTTDAARAAYELFCQAAELDSEAVSYERILISDQFQGTLTASSGFRSSQTDSIYLYLSEEEPDYILLNQDSGQKSASIYDSSYLDTRDQYAVFFGGNHGLLKLETNAQSERRILVIKDSYANCFLPFLLPNYQEIYIVDPRYYQGDLNALVEEEAFTEILYLYNAQSVH